MGGGMNGWWVVVWRILRPLRSCQSIRSIGSVGASAYTHTRPPACIAYTRIPNTRKRASSKPTSSHVFHATAVHPLCSTFMLQLYPPILSLSLSLSLTHTHAHTPFPISNCLSAPSLPASMPGPSDYGAPGFTDPNPQKFNLSKVPSSIELAMILGGA